MTSAIPPGTIRSEGFDDEEPVPDDTDFQGVLHKLDAMQPFDRYAAHMPLGPMKPSMKGSPGGIRTPWRPGPMPGRRLFEPKPRRPVYEHRLCRRRRWCCSVPDMGLRHGVRQGIEADPMPLSTTPVMVKGAFHERLDDPGVARPSATRRVTEPSTPSVLPRCSKRDSGRPG